MVVFSNLGKPIAVFWVTVLLMGIPATGSAKRDSLKNVELVVVFKKEVELATAQEFMRSFPYPYRQGMDSSRGKIHFYSTGPKFIATLPRRGRESFVNRCKAAPEIYQVYEANWKIMKD